jgi:hypothetical protein
MDYLTTLHKLETRITAAGGSVLAVTAEPEEHLAATRATTGLTSTVLVDINNALATYLKEQKILDIAISEKKGYAHGMAQPGVLAIKGKGDGTVLEKWAIVPGPMNLNGGKNRPELEQVWENVEAKLQGKKPVHQKYALQGFFHVVKAKFFG